MFWPYGDFCEDKILGYIMNPTDIVQKLWNYCNVLRDDGMKTTKTMGSALHS
jgi:hypothetical protein